MYEVEPAHWATQHTELWGRIERHLFERPDHALDFTRRLARDRGWSLAFARGAVEEYRRFCFLAMIGPSPVTPSEEVDEVWHQHLTYSRDYWESWCSTVLGGPLHHDPTEGGPAAQTRYRARYAETLALYEAYFGPPDPAYWPATHRRFGTRPRYRIVDRTQAVVLARPSWPDWLVQVAARCGLTLGWALALILQDTGAARADPSGLPLNPFDWPATPFLTLYGALAIATIIFLTITSMHMRSTGLGKGSDAQVEAATGGLDLLHLAWLAGGRDQAIGIVLAGFVDAGAARVAQTSRAIGFMRLPEIEVDSRGAILVEPFTAFRGFVQGPYTYNAFGRSIKPGIEAIEGDLACRGLVPVRQRIENAYLTMAAAVTVFWAFGLVRVAVGHAHGKPVGYLWAMIVLTGILSIMIAVLPPMRTPLGSAVLRWYRERYRRAATAPREHELLFALALCGPAVLSGTHLDDVGRLIRANAVNGGDSGSGSGGNGGGSGCGGCGGGGD